MNKSGVFEIIEVGLTAFIQDSKCHTLAQKIFSHIVHHDLDCSHFISSLANVVILKFAIFGLEEWEANHFNILDSLWYGFLKGKYIHLCTVWKLRKFSLTYFWQKFRESNGFST